MQHGVAEERDILCCLNAQPGLSNCRSFTMKKISKVITAIALASSSTAYALSTNDTLGDWRSATYSEKLNLAQIMADRLNKPGVSPSALVVCISETAGDGGLDHMKISETAAACAVIL